jgi:hypothetical protein
MIKLSRDMACLALKESEAEVKRLKSILFQLTPKKEKERKGEKKEKEKRSSQRKNIRDSKQNQFT